MATYHHRPELYNVFVCVLRATMKMDDTEMIGFKGRFSAFSLSH